MTKRRPYAETWKATEDVWQLMRDALTSATTAFRLKSPVGIAPDADDYERQRDHFEQQAQALIELETAISAMTVELSRNMYRSGWTLREVGRTLNTNHSGVRNWIQQTGASSPRDDL